MPADASAGEAFQSAGDPAHRGRRYEEFLQVQLAELGQRLLSEYWRAGADFAERRDAGASAAAGADVRVEEVSAGDASTAEVREP
ncbi:unnamed protein product [Prorocentrum cordatum]|uniref:Uncharacterized protein n=1 Tax=Prorocentrum cordatum TaxID=2364126 RepID=A0ABN9ST55_9DINO|nr:unnamed protein product [Polarella glacialis]